MTSTPNGPDLQHLRDIRAPKANDTLNQLLKYVLLGGSNFLLTLGVFAFLTKVMNANYLLSLIAAWLVGMIFMYATNFLWVFTANGALRFDARFLRFVGVGLISISVNTAALGTIVQNWSTDPFWTQMALMPFVVIFNFAATKYFSLRGRRSAPK